MEEHESKQSNKLNISPFWTAPAIMTVLTAGINFFCDDEKLKIFLALLAPFVASLIAYILQYLFAIFMFSPQDFAMNKRLKRDEKMLVKQLKEAKGNPDLDMREEIEDIKRNLSETRKLRSQIGRSSLEK